jgi:hypothetical protein
MHGLYCKSEQSFTVLLKPLLHELDTLWWIVDCKRIPIRGGEQVLDGMVFKVPAFESTSTWLWRPGSLSKLGDALQCGNWTYFLGFNAAESDAPDTAVRLRSSGTLWSAEFFETLQKEAEIFLVQVEGWWEFYPRRPEWFKQIQSLTQSKMILSPQSS